MISSSKKLQDNYKELECSEHRILKIVHNNHNLISNINNSLVTLEENVNETFSEINNLRASNSLLLKRLKGEGPISTASIPSQSSTNESSESYKNIKLFLIEGITFEDIKKSFLSPEFLKAMGDIDTVLTNLSNHQEKIIFPFFQESFQICVTLVSDIVNRLMPFFLLEIDQLEILTYNSSFRFLNGYRQHMAFLEKYNVETFDRILATYNKRKAVIIEAHLQEVNELLISSNKTIKSDLGYLDEIIGDNSLSLFLNNARIQRKITGSFELTMSSIQESKGTDQLGTTPTNYLNEKSGLAINSMFRVYISLIEKWNAIEIPSSFIFILESKNFIPTDKNYVFLFTSLVYDVIKLNKEFQIFESSFFKNTPTMSPSFIYNVTGPDKGSAYGKSKSTLSSLNPFNKLSALNPFGNTKPPKKSDSNYNKNTNKSNNNVNTIFANRKLYSRNVHGLSEYNNIIYTFLKNEIERIENIFLLISISFNLDRITYKNSSLINSNQTQIIFEKLSINILCRVKDKLNELPLILTKKSKITSFLFSKTNSAFKDIEYNIYLLFVFSNYWYSYNSLSPKDFPNLVLYINLIESNINIIVKNTDELIKSICIGVHNMEEKMLYLIITNLLVQEFSKGLMVKEQNDYILKIYKNKLNELLKDCSVLLIGGLSIHKKSGNVVEKELWTFVKWKNVVIDLVKKLFGKVGDYCVKNKISVGNGVRIYVVEYIMESFIELVIKQRNDILKDSCKDENDKMFGKKLKEIKCEEIDSLVRVYKMDK